MTGSPRGPAPASADISGWGFRGDPALRELVVGYAGTMPGAVPLLAQRLDPPRQSREVDFVWAFAVPLHGSWWLQVGSASGSAAKPDGAGVFLEPLRPLPEPVLPLARISVVVHTELMNDPQEPETLILMAPPGIGTVDYRPCAADGGTTQVVARGDALLVLRLGGRPFPQPLRGQVTVTAADGAVITTERVDDWSPEVRRQSLPGPVPEPSYENGVTYSSGPDWDLRLTRPGQRAVLDRAGGGRPAVQEVAVVVACLGEGSLYVEVRGRPATVPCDGSRREVYRGPYDLTGDDLTVTSAGEGANLLAFVRIPPFVVSR